jgi:hypothetical protein
VFLDKCVDARLLRADDVVGMSVRWWHVSGFRYDWCASELTCKLDVKWSCQALDLVGTDGAEAANSAEEVAFEKTVYR